MLTPTTTVAVAARLTTFGSRGLQIQTALARGTSCPYSTAFSTSARQPTRTLSTKISSPQGLARKPTTPPSQCQLAARRSASTTTSSSSSSAPNPGRQQAAGQAGAGAGAGAKAQLDWNGFFQLRKTRRRFQLASSVVTMTAGALGGSALLVGTDMDWVLSRVPMDPIFALGIITLSFSAVGWLAGPSLGSAIFYALRRGVKQPMARKESEFFNRIRKNRVDPSNSSLSGNAVPDFYGEKISSVAGYRQWLKDQRAFNKKRTSFV